MKVDGLWGGRGFQRHGSLACAIFSLGQINAQALAFLRGWDKHLEVDVAAQVEAKGRGLGAPGCHQSVHKWRAHGWDLSTQVWQQQDMQRLTAVRNPFYWCSERDRGHMIQPNRLTVECELHETGNAL